MRVLGWRGAMGLRRSATNVGFLLLAASVTACSGSDDEPKPKENGEEVVTHVIAGSRCQEYRGTFEVPLTSSGPCPTVPEQGELCWVCRNGEPNAGVVSGLRSLSYFEYTYNTVTGRERECTTTADAADNCVVVFGGEFEAVAEGVPGPTGLMRETLEPGTPTSDLGPHRLGIPAFSKDGQMQACTNVYGDVPDDADELHSTDPCPDENRCPNGCAHLMVGWWGEATLEAIEYVMADDTPETQCMSGFDPEECAAAGYTPLTY